MPQKLLQLLLARLSLNPPVLKADELLKHPKSTIEALETSGIIRSANAGTSFACADCGSLRRVQFESNGKTTRGFISCAECGIAEVDLAKLRRWAIDPEKFMAAIFFRASGATTAVSELVNQRLWRIGKASWSGRSRELLFALSRLRDHDDAALTVIKKRPKSVLFVPTERDTNSWSNAISNAVVALESVSAMEGMAITFDSGYVENVLSAGDAATGGPKKRIIRRRSSRTAKIEALRNVMIEHLRAARDHAVSTRDRTGDATLLPCPTKEEFAKLADVAPYDVTRCFQDEAGGDLNTLWDWANDLDRILAYRG